MDIWELDVRLTKIEAMLDDIYYHLDIPLKKCNICNREFKIFLPYPQNPTIKPRPNAMCPHCKSLERHRSLWKLLQSEGILSEPSGIKLLHFAPEKVFRDIFSKDTSIDYYPVDFNPESPGIREVVDITNIPYADKTFDLIICNHVLEHIVDDKKAMSELKRVLRPASSDALNGLALITIPIKLSLETTLEDPELDTPEKRLEAYGQDDHVRLYGRDFPDRLRAAGFTVEEIDTFTGVPKEERIKYGIDIPERIYKCTY